MVSLKSLSTIWWLEWACVKKLETAIYFTTSSRGYGQGTHWSVARLQMMNWCILKLPRYVALRFRKPNLCPNLTLAVLWQHHKLPTRAYTPQSCSACTMKYSLLLFHFLIYWPWVTVRGPIRSIYAITGQEMLSHVTLCWSVTMNVKKFFCLCLLDFVCHAMPSLWSHIASGPDFQVMMKEMSLPGNKEDSNVVGPYQISQRSPRVSWVAL